MFKGFFSKKEQKESPEDRAKIAEERMKAAREKFLNSIRYIPQTYIIDLAKKVINKTTTIESLTDDQLDVMIAYYKNKLNVSS